MKKIVLLSMLGLLLASCTKDGLKKPDDNSGESVATSYLSVSLVAANRAGTRVTDAGELENTDFENGTKAENEVKRVRFFFFDSAGNPAQVYKRQSSSASESYIDVYPSAIEEAGTAPSEPVEKIIQVTLGINPASNDNLPQSVVAVINPDEQILALGQTPSGTLYGPSLDELRDAVYDFKTGLTEENFVMSNSVYVDNVEKKIIDAVTLKDNNFADTLEEAQKQENQVIIYVERVLARLDLTIALEGNPITTEAGSAWPVRDEKWNSFTVDGDETDIYVSFLGWNITATPSASRLVKQVDAGWTDQDIFGSNTPSGGPWNTADYHRSFWATNPQADFFEYQYGTFDTPTEKVQDNFYQANANKIPEGGKCAPVYLQENAGPATKDGASTTDPTVKPTKVILAARLVDEKGAPLTLAEWAYKKYTLSALKTMFANDVLQLLYKKTGADKFEKIEPKDLTFKTATQLETKESNYYVYPVLTPEAENMEWYLRENATSETFSEELDVKNVNAYMRDKINHVMVWNEGYTYYYFDIRHLGNEGSAASYGIVRNHLYQANVTKVAGLGTPVYEPGEIIIPEKPEGDESIISAEVKILQWRIVSQNYDLIW